MEMGLSNSANKRVKRRQGGGRLPAHPDLESQLFEWFRAERMERRIINYRRLREKAQELRDELGLPDEFKCSDHWIFKFCRRHRICSR